ncbi:hypothetical protein ACLB2K_043649 [Fragaria x ananassa]
MNGCKAVATPLITNEKFRKEDGSPKANASSYRSLIGSLLYLTTTRPDIMYATSLLSRFMHSPSRIHYGAAKRILRYLQGTINYGIWYQPTSKTKLVGFESKLFGYTDSDWAGSMDDMRSTSGYAFTIGSGIFSWSSKKQETTALSSAEAEYVAAASSACQAIWLRRIFEDMGEKQENATRIFSDNKSAIAMAKNPVCHNKTKHIKIKHHFLREASTNKEIELHYCKTELQLADIFTNALYAIQLAVDDTNFSRIMGATTSKEAWDLLKEEFQGTAKMKRKIEGGTSTAAATIICHVTRTISPS